MRVTPLAIPEVLLIEPEAFADERGFFMELWNDTRYAITGITGPFVQDNLSYSRRHVLRGLHYQWPCVQGKLVQALAGAVYDVAVDLRPSSPSYCQWVGVELSADNRRQLWVPPGFAHGFVVLSEAAIFHYKVTAPYVKEDEGTLMWNDPRFGVEWPVAKPQISPRDAAAVPFESLSPERLPR
ncbi:MAG: dTDP-4-dehydrorhamnose 3,5-epimerase [Gemmatimonadota bacterium]|nr:dTDP-4-dehydrorhamnose 3,5-epimerase [Gemmatimonadota bacterium]